MKYIMYENIDGESFPIIFPKTIQHNEINRAIKKEFPGLKAVSAGYYKTDAYMKELGPHVEGESITLKLKSNVKDDETIDMHLRI